MTRGEKTNNKRRKTLEEKETEEKNKHAQQRKNGKEENENVYLSKRQRENSLQTGNDECFGNLIGRSSAEVTFYGGSDVLRRSGKQRRFGAVERFWKGVFIKAELSLNVGVWSFLWTFW